MSNMSYCRFQNTSRDLMDCIEAINDNDTEDLSSNENWALRDLLEYSRTIVEMEGQINEILYTNYEKER